MTVNNPMGKPRKDIVTGCVHITNWTFPNGATKRICSYCDSVQPADIDEEILKYCYYCGETFDHTDDDPAETEGQDEQAGSL